jgi:PII-like signaling protein
VTPVVKVLLVFVNEADSWHNRPLYQAVVERLHQLGVAGATAQVGLMGFGHHMRLITRACSASRTIGPSPSLSVDDEARLRSILPTVRAMVREGLIVLLDAEVILDSDSKRKAD